MACPLFSVRLDWESVAQDGSCNRSCSVQTRPRNYRQP